MPTEYPRHQNLADDLAAFSASAPALKPGR